MKTIFIFCEGAHDISFLHKVLSEMNGLTVFKTALKDYPNPLSDLYSKRYSKKYFEDQVLEEMRAPMVPSLSLTDKDKNYLFLFYSIGGDKKKDDTINEIKEIDDIMKLKDRGTKIDIDWYGFLFFFDADTNEFSSRLTSIRDNFKGQFPNIETLNANVWSESLKLGCYIYHRDTDKKGTLEDIVEKVLVNQDLYKEAGEFVTKNEGTAFSNKKSPEAKRKKVALTISGQFLDPGKSLATMLKNSSFINKKSFENNDKCKEISALFKSIVEEKSIA